MKITNRSISEQFNGNVRHGAQGDTLNTHTQHTYSTHIHTTHTQHTYTYTTHIHNMVVKTVCERNV
jgi:hypothetical protein